MMMILFATYVALIHFHHSVRAFQPYTEAGKPDLDLSEEKPD